MSRKQLIITGVIVLALIIFGGLFGFYYYLNQKTIDSPYSTGPLSFFSGIFSSNKTGGGTSGGGISNSNSNTTGGTFTPDQSGSSTVPDQSIPLLRHITTLPIAGATAYDRVVGTTTQVLTKGSKPKAVNVYGTFLRYIDRATGQMYETATGTLSINRITNTTFPSVYTAIFDSTGSSTVMQRILNTDGETITTYYGHAGQMSGSSTEVSLATNVISNSISFFAPSPTKDSIFSLVNAGNGAQGILSKYDGSNKKVLWSSPLREWLVSWPNANQILLTTKPSAGVVGYSYLLNPTTGSATRFAGYIFGLTVNASPDTTKALISQSINGGFSNGLYTAATRAITPFYLNTLPEKCVWSSKSNSILYCAVPSKIPTATYPDDWYKGLVSFSDSIWKINLDTGAANRLAVLPDLAKHDIDAINLTLDSTEDYLLFTDKNDLSLWGLKLPSAAVATSTKK